MKSPKDTKVVVLGAGVAGLTAAQELGERGFQVTVYSPGNVLGGMARSQFFVPPTNAQTERILKLGNKLALSRVNGDGTVPGEHGFHFYPSFYRHVTDTMSRIDYLDPTGQATGHTVDQNLEPTLQQGVVDGDRSYTYERDKSSPAVLWRELEQTLQTPGVTGLDVARFGAKIFEYMTSCTGRRKSYEKISAWEFLGGDHFTREFGELIDRVPQLLVSMRARECDARTYGNVVTQLSLDQFRNGKDTDRTLNAPTTQAWITPWQKYLVSCGVVFEDGQLTGIGADGALTIKTPNAVVTPAYDYAVVAVPIEQAQLLVTAPLAALSSTLKSIRDFPAAAALRWMSGIQYYFLEEVSGSVRGHVIYTNAPWGLSSISQSQFWSAVGDGGVYVTPRGLVCGVLSVDIANWDVMVNDPASAVNGKSAKMCSKDEIAAEVWRQMTSDLKASAFRLVSDGAPKPQTLRADYDFYHLDDDITFPDPTKAPTAIVSEILINRPGAWELRPGTPGAYELSIGKIAFAGTYMKTYTRLTTTEAADESARHAVNAILVAATYAGDHCTTWNMEDSEDDSLLPLVQLDEVLWKHRQPHWMRTARVIESLETILPRHPNGTERTAGFARGDVRPVVDAIEVAMRSASIPSASRVARRFAEMLGVRRR